MLMPRMMCCDQRLDNVLGLSGARVVIPESELGRLSPELLRNCCGCPVLGGIIWVGTGILWAGTGACPYDMAGTGACPYDMAGTGACPYDADAAHDAL